MKSDEIPKAVGSFVTSGDYAMDPIVLQALSTADVISREYTDGQTPVDFVMIGGTDRGALHDPRSCLVGAGWSLENDHTEALPGSNINVRTCHAVGLGSQGFDIVYLYVVNGRVINEPTQIRLSMLFSALLGRRNTPVYFLRFMTPDTTQGGINPTTHAAMERFAANMWQTLSGRITKV
jgi:EpsI family protein